MRADDRKKRDFLLLLDQAREEESHRNAVPESNKSNRLKNVKKKKLRNAK